MMNPPAHSHEDQHIEFKRQLSNTLEKEAIAFLNSRDGGAIVIGVADNGDIVGVENSDAPQATPQAIPHAEALWKFCRKPKGRTEIQAHLQLKDREHLRKMILQPLLKAGLLLQTLPDKPTSPKQQFVSAPGVLDKQGKL